MQKSKYIHLVWLVLLLLTACGEDDSSSADEVQAVRFAVVEDSWQDSPVMMTRAGETMTSLKTYGFGLFSTDLRLNNQQATWNSTNLAWNVGAKLLWPSNTVPAIGSLDIRAYAPYNYSDIAITMTDNKITFAPAVANTTDLLWADRAIDAGGTVTLNFKHALAKLSFGTITNNYGRSITLTNVTATGSLYTTGDLLLDDGTWTTSSTETRNYSSSPSQDIANGATADLDLADILQIPGPTVTVTFTFTSTDFGTDTVSTAVTLEQAKHKTLNLTIGLNHEVVVE